MLKKRLGWVFGLASLASIPLVSALDLTQPFSLLFGVFTDLFNAAEPYIGQDGFQRFMFWLLIFMTVIFAGQKLVSMGADDAAKKSTKRMVNVIAAVLATAGAFGISSDIMRSLGNVVGMIVPFGLLIGALFAWVYNPNFMQNRPRVRHFVRLLVYLFGLIAADYVAFRMNNTLTSSYLGNMFFQLIELFFVVMFVYEFIMVFAAGAGAAAAGAGAVGTGLATGAGHLRTAADGVGNAFRTLFGNRRPNNIPEYTNFPTDLNNLEMEIRNVEGRVAQLTALRANLTANPALRGTAPFIRGVRAAGAQGRATIGVANGILATIAANPGLRYVAAPERARLANATARFTAANNALLAQYGWLQVNMY